MATPHVLVVKRDKIGDLLLTTPLLAHLRQCMPQARIEVLCTDYNAWVISDDRHVDRVIALPRVRIGRTLRIGKVPANLVLRGKLARMRYDAVLVAQGEESSRAIKRAFAVRARRVIAYAAPPYRYGRRLTDPIPPPPDTMHEIDRMLALARILDLPESDRGCYPKYRLPDAARSFARGWLAERALAPGGYVVLGLGARRATRRPSPAQVARWSCWWLERHGLATVFVWTPGGSTNATYPGDDPAAESVLRMGLPHVHPYRGPIDETLGLVAFPRVWKYCAPPPQVRPKKSCTAAPNDR